MSAEVQESGGKRGKSKQKKMTVRVDFTPMVDMNMLLITFFMLCTTLSKPQTMEISMPSNDKDITENQKSMVKASQAITLLLGADNKLYYYEGEPNYKDYTSLKETSYGADGLRAVLLQKNAVAVNKVRELKQQKLDLKITDDEFKKQVLPSALKLMPTSSTICPAETYSAPTTPGFPAATIKISALLVSAGISFVFVWQIVTVAFCPSSIIATGLPMTRLLPITTVFLPARSI